MVIMGENGDGESQKRSGNYNLNRRRGGRQKGKKSPNETLELTSVLSGMKKASWVGFTANEEEERVCESEHKSLEINQS